MDSVMKLTLATFLALSTLLIFSIAYYTVSYSEEWKALHYASFVDEMNSLASPIVFLLVVLMPMCVAMRRVKRALPVALILLGAFVLTLGFDYRLSLTLSAIASSSLLLLSVRRDVSSTMIHAATSLFVLDFALFKGSAHLTLFYISSSLYVLGIIVRFYYRGKAL